MSTSSSSLPSSICRTVMQLKPPAAGIPGGEALVA
jgi:hypothetical protein